MFSLDGDNKKLKLFFCYVVVLFFIVVAGTLIFLFNASSKKHFDTVKIGYFQGGRTMLVYRAFVNGFFREENINLELVTKTLGDPTYYVMPPTYEEIKNKGRLYGKATGVELIEEMMKGNVDGATVGELAFILAVEKGLPIVAVAELGHDVKGQAGHAIVFNEDVRIESSEDIKGKILASRRSSGGDAVFLREFLLSEGLEVDDVTIIDNVDEGELGRLFQNKEIDGGYFHLMSIRPWVRNLNAQIYRTLDWVNPEYSHAILVFRKDFVAKNSDVVERVIRAYMKEIYYERTLSTEEKRREPSSDEYKGLEIEADFYGMNLPQYDLKPIVEVDLLNELQELFLRWKYLQKSVRFEDFVDNSFVEKIYKERF